LAAVAAAALTAQPRHELCVPAQEHARSLGRRTLCPRQWEPLACEDLGTEGTSRSSAAGEARRRARARPINRGDLINKNDRDFDEVYDRGDILGYGAFGFVLKCEHKVSGSVRAVKFVSHRNVDDKEAFERELQALVRLDHPNIMRLVEYFEQDEQFILVCQFCEGGDLADYMIEQFRTHSDGLPESMSTNIIRMVLKALFGCHTSDVIHKDVKPANFVFASKDIGAPLVLIDLGLGEFGVHPELRA